jgi:predicted  nucleic acid-binding Zn-ribbon protein
MNKNDMPSLVSEEYMDMVRNITGKQEIYPFIMRLLEENLELIRRINQAQDAYERELKVSSSHYNSWHKAWTEANALKEEVKKLQAEIQKLSRRKK